MDIQYHLLNDAFYSALSKAKAVTTCLLSARDISSLPSSTLFDAVWAIDDYLEELLTLHNKQ